MFLMGERERDALIVDSVLFVVYFKLSFLLFVNMTFCVKFVITF